MRQELRYEIEVDFTADGPRWRATARDSYGQLVDSTRSVSSPGRAVRDQLDLMRGRYWAGDGGDPHREWSTAA
jgi:hypothetical protein